MKTLARVFVTILLAVAAAWFGWWSAVSPAAFHRVPIGLVKAINFPVATVGWLIHSSQDIDFWYRSSGCEFCTPYEHAVRYFELAIPVYVAVFAVVQIAWLLVKRRAV